MKKLLFEKQGISGAERKIRKALGNFQASVVPPNQTSVVISRLGQHGVKSMASDSFMTFVRNEVVPLITPGQDPIELEVTILSYSARLNTSALRYLRDERGAAVFYVRPPAKQEAHVCAFRDATGRVSSNQIAEFFMDLCPHRSVPIFAWNRFRKGKRGFREYFDEHLPTSTLVKWAISLFSPSTAHVTGISNVASCFKQANATKALMALVETCFGEDVAKVADNLDETFLYELYRYLMEEDWVYKLTETKQTNKRHRSSMFADASLLLTGGVRSEFHILQHWGILPAEVEYCKDTSAKLVRAHNDGFRALVAETRKLTNMESQLRIRRALEVKLAKQLEDAQRESSMLEAEIERTRKDKPELDRLALELMRETYAPA